MTTTIKKGTTYNLDNKTTIYTINGLAANTRLWSQAG